MGAQEIWQELAKLHERMVMDNERASRIVARELLESLYADCDKKVRRCSDR